MMAYSTRCHQTTIPPWRGPTLLHVPCGEVVDMIALGFPTCEEVSSVSLPNPLPPFPGNVTNSWTM